MLLGPKNFVSYLRDCFLGNYEMRNSYRVDVQIAVEILAENNPTAATWWRENTPHLFRSKQCLSFEAEVCEEIAEESPKAQDMKQKNTTGQILFI